MMSMTDDDHEMPEEKIRAPTDAGNDTMAQITRVQTRYTDYLMEKPNVIGVGVGLKKSQGIFTHKPCLVVLVSQKVPSDELAPEDRIPKELDGVALDVQEAGFLSAQADE